MTVTYEIVANLARLPPELALDILHDLRLWDILLLIRRDNARVNSLLMESRRYRILLGEDPETFTKTCKSVKDYLDFAAPRKLQLCYDNYWFEYTDPFVSQGMLDGEPADGRHNLVNDLHARICELSNLDYVKHDFWYPPPPRASRHKALLPYVKEPKTIPDVGIHSTLEEWKKYWDIVTEAKAVLLCKCSDQILECARLLEENPDILKRSTDPSQELRANTQHIVSRMKHVAEMLMKRDLRNFRRIEYLDYEFLAVIPFDSALERLLTMMEKHKVSSGDQLLSHHPTAIMSLAQTVVDGLPYFYSQDLLCPAGVPLDSDADTKPLYTRTQNSPWSTDQGEPKEENRGAPVFTPSVRKPLKAWRRAPKIGLIRPHSAMEEEWVRSFVKLYRVLEGLEKEQS